MNITPLEKKRLQNINFIMEDIHDSVNQIYETLQPDFIIDIGIKEW